MTKPKTQEGWRVASVRIPVDMYEQLRLRAKEDYCSIASIVLRAIASWLKEADNEK